MFHFVSLLCGGGDCTQEYSATDSIPVIVSFDFLILRQGLAKVVRVSLSC